MCALNIDYMHSLACNGMFLKNNENTNKNSNIEIKPQLNSDTVSFSGSRKKIKNENGNYCEQIAQKTNVREARQYLKNGEANKALETLGFKTSVDEKGNVTLNNGFTALLSNKGETVKTLSDYRIDTNKLLENVVKIEGEAVFEDDFMPNHYIETDGISTTSQSTNKADGIKREFLKLNPQYQKALQENDTYTILTMCGYDIEKDENGQITFNGDLKLGHHENKNFGYTSFEELGINNENLLNGIKKINGNLKITSDSSLEKINPNLEITGNIVYSGNKKEQLFKGFSTAEQVADTYKNKGITPEIVKSMAETGVLKSIKVQGTHSQASKNNSVTYYLNSDDVKQKLSDRLIEYTVKAQQVNELLEHGDDITAFEILGYDIDSDFETDKITINGDYVPYFLKDNDNPNENSIVSYDLLGINQEKLLKNVVKIDGEAFLPENLNNEKTIETNNSAKNLKTNPIFQKAVKAKDTYTILEMCGFDVEESKDGRIIINGDFNSDFLQNEKYGYTSFEELGVNSQDLIDDIGKIKGNLLISKDSPIKRLSTNLEVTGVVIHPFEKEDLFADFYTSEDVAFMADEDYEISPKLIDKLADNGYLNTINSVIATDTGLQPSLRYFPYEGENEEVLNELKENNWDTSKTNISSIFTQNCEREYLQDFDILPELETYMWDDDSLETSNGAFKNHYAKKSFIMTVGWALSENTRKIFKKHATPYIGLLISKDDRLHNIEKQFKAGKINEDERDKQIKDLKYTDKQQRTLASYRLKGWAEAGTKEFAQNLKAGAMAANLYQEEGILAFTDEKIINAIIEWEEKQKTKENNEKEQVEATA